MISSAAATDNVKTILLITPYLPYRNVGHAGGKAIYDFIFELKKRSYRVCLASLAWPEESCHFEHLRELCDDTYFLVSVPVFTDSLFNSFQTNPIWFFPRVLKGVFKHFRIRSRLNRAVRRMIRRHEPDLIQVEYTAMALYLGKLERGPLKILHLHDLMMKPYARLWMTEEEIFARVFRFLFYVVLKDIELRFCRTFDRVLVKSQHDKRLLLQHGHFDVRVFPLGVHSAPGIVPYKCREARSVLFVGAMFRKVNEKAALYFIDHILPLLERKVGPVKFYVVGCSPSPGLKQRSSENIVVTDFVEDLAPFYRQCQVFAAPLFVGGGMIFKVLQAMSFGLPVVSSTVANEGIQGRNGSELLIADNAEDFSNKLATLMNDGELWQKISSGGHGFVNAKYAWNVVMDEYLRNINPSSQIPPTPIRETVT